MRWIAVAAALLGRWDYVLDDGAIAGGFDIQRLAPAELCEALAALAEGSGRSVGAASFSTH